MSIFTKVFGGGVKAAADGVVDVAGKAADIVERWAPSDAKKHEMQLELQKAFAQSAAEARTYDPRSTGGGIVGEFINVIVDGATRMIRPGVTIMLIGGVFGFWHLEVQTVDPIVLGWGEVVIGFWFGVRTITKDLPGLIRSIAKLKKEFGK